VPKDGPSPAGVRGGVNDAIALYFRDPTLAATVAVPQEPPLGDLSGSMAAPRTAGIRRKRANNPASNVWRELPHFGHCRTPAPSLGRVIYGRS
jgi:hypothetical protein